MESVENRWHYRGVLALLLASAVFLCIRLGYLYLIDINHFPINTIKIAADFQRISRQEIAAIITTYQHHSFFSLPARQLQHDLEALDWADEVTVERTWPDLLNIKLTEKEPIAKWNNGLITIDGRLFNVGKTENTSMLVELKGPDSQKNDVLQIYQKLSKLLSTFGLTVVSVQLHDNQSWDVTLDNGIALHLGKQDLEKRVERFCKAYRLTLASKIDQLASIDLRYERGMAVRWKSNT